MTPAGENTVLFRDAPNSLKRAEIRAFARRLSAKVTDRRGFCCLITSDAELTRLNRQFRGKNRTTDVLSFPSGDPKGPLGDIAISAERAMKQAAEFGHASEDEISILMLHGVLHLLGMDHEADGGGMARAERQWRKDLGLPTGLIERVNR